MSTMTVPPSVYLVSLQYERAGVEVRLAGATEPNAKTTLTNRLKAIDAEIARTTKLAKTGD